MPGITQDLYIAAERYGNLAPTEQKAWAVAQCPHCAGNQMAVIARTTEGKSPSLLWLRCVNCANACVSIDNIIQPSPLPLSTPIGLPKIDSTIWTEIRACLSVGANTAAVMLCRKILFHTAVSFGLPPKDAKDRAPSYLQAVEHLEAEGVITSRMRKWVDRVKDVGNEANHELAPIAQQSALDVAKFTEQLLRLAYEMDELMIEAASEPLTSE